MSSSLNVAISAIAEDFQVRPDDITAAVTSYVVTTSAFLLPATAIANRLGYTRTFLVGALSSCLMAILISTSHSLPFLIITRALQGLTSALVFCSNYAVISYYLEPKERGSAIGINTAAVYLGLSLSPCLGGVLTDCLGWQMLFYLSSAGFFAAFYIIRSVPYDRPNTTGYPYLRMLLIFSSMMCILCACSLLKAAALYSYMLLFGLLLMGLYLYLESRSKQPLLPISLLLSNQNLSFELLGALFNYMATFAVILMLSLHFQVILGFSASLTGLLLVAQPAVQCLISPLSGRLCNRLNPHFLVLGGMLLSTLATALFIFLSPGLSLYILLLGQLMAGLGAGIFSSPNTVIIMGSVSKKDYALASSLLALARNCGMALCMTLFTFILSSCIEVTESSPDYPAQLSSALTAGFSVSTLLGVIGMLCSLKSTLAAGRLGEQD
ncbi:MAG: MFS transporter [Succinivibrio sp.]|nr:MFS transporter [Succinivibrio sp.]